MPIAVTVACAVGLTTAMAPAQVVPAQAAEQGGAVEQGPVVEQAPNDGAPLSPLGGDTSCDQRPEPARWVDAGTPDQGAQDAVISAHRGAPTLAPENTVESYEYAFAYGVELVEVDVQQTADGRFVALHDSTVDRTTDGTGRIGQLTYAEVRALNAADYEPWRGSEYDPAQIASLEEVLALAARAGGGLELDIKASVTDVERLADLVEEYGLIEESVFNRPNPRILLAHPGARLIYNRSSWEPPALLYELTHMFAVFGSRLDEYTPEAVAAIHDGCGIVIPHSYDAGSEQEVAQFEAARAIGADGVQTNQPALVVAAAGEPVLSRFLIEWNGPAQLGSICLVNDDNGFGFPGKQVQLRRGTVSVEVTTGRDGCVSPPEESSWVGGTAAFAGDGAVAPVTTRLIPVPGLIPEPARR